MAQDLLNPQVNLPLKTSSKNVGGPLKKAHGMDPKNPQRVFPRQVLSVAARSRTLLSTFHVTFPPGLGTAAFQRFFLASERHVA